MRSIDVEFMDGIRRAALAPRSTQTPSQWAEQHVQFFEPTYKGPFSLAGAEYCREPLDLFGNPAVTDITLVQGSQSRKTTILMAGIAWALINRPTSIFWVMPSHPLAKSFSKSRFVPMLRKTERTRALIPTGNARHGFGTTEMLLGASAIKFVGANSIGQLASTPAGLVVQDETDKLPDALGDEAGASNLADQRTKGQIDAQRWKTSTPSVVEGPIWQAFLKGSQLRYFVPCPHCSKRVLLAWSAQYTTFRATGSEAWVVWDKEAKRADGTWDFERVRRSVRFVCPHCAGHIQERHKRKCVAEGIYQPTNPLAPASHVSSHLPSLYATTPETSLEKLAEKFLVAKHSLEGVQGFINGDLAEPYMAQDTLGQRVELITRSIPQEAEKPTRILTVDTQARAPFFWYVVRDWFKTGSHGVAFGSADTWDELRALQERFEVLPQCVGVDSGYGAKSDAEVYAECAKSSKAYAQEDRLPLLIGWLPMKGFPGRKRWPDKSADGVLRPYYTRDIDPFEGTSSAGLVTQTFLGFATDYFKDILDSLRRKTYPGAPSWSVSETMATETYWRHMDGEHKVAIASARSPIVSYPWVPRSKHWPNHGFDCEVEQIVVASFLGLFDPTQQRKEQPK